MKSYVYIFLLVFLCGCGCMKKQDYVNIEIIETEDCLLKYPNQISIKNDSIVLILDRAVLYEINQNTGVLSVADISDIRSSYRKVYDSIKEEYDFYDYEKMVSIYDCFDMVSYNNEQNKKIVSSVAFSDNSRQAIYVNFCSEDTSVCMLYNADSTLSIILSGDNIPSYFSEKEILIPCINYFEIGKYPDSVPVLEMFTKKGNNYFNDRQIYLPFKEKENRLIGLDSVHNDYAYMPYMVFCNNHEKVYISTGLTIYSFDENYYAKEIICTDDKIKNFTINGDEITALVADSANQYYLQKYSLSIGEKIDKSVRILSDMQIFTSCFYNDELYIIYLNEEKFYLSKTIF